MSFNIQTYSDRIVQSYTEQRRGEAHGRLVAALRTIPPDQREAEAMAAIKRLVTQKVVELKIKQLTEEQLEQLQKQLA